MMNKAMADEAINQQAKAWLAVFDQIKAHNPKFSDMGRNGLESVLNEIKRLQALEVRS